MKTVMGIEAGGTKFVCAHGTGPQDIRQRVVIKTTQPDDTLRQVIEYYQAIQNETPLAALGVGAFGPVDLNQQSPTYGYITTTPKKDWIHCNLLGALREYCSLPIGFDTDVNAAALGEYRWGAAQQLRDFIYLTIGTGIGGGIMVNGKLLHGAMHPEVGHILIPRRADDSFAGTCQYHGYHCWESLAAGPAIKERWQVDSALDLPPEHPAWNLEAYYLGLGLATITTMLSPQRIILGGGVMRQGCLLPQVRQQLLLALGGYINHPTVIEGINDYVVPPGLGDNAGICGAFALAAEAVVTQ